MDSNTLLDAVKKHLNAPSDYALAKHILKVDMQSLRAMRQRGLSEERALQCAELLGIPPEEVLPAIRAERASDPKVKATWKKIAESMRSALGLAAAVAVAISLLLPGKPAHAAHPGAFLHNADGAYIMRGSGVTGAMLNV